MLIYNETIFSLVADLWNAKARVEGEREQAWCAESVRAELRASGERPDVALGEAVKETVKTMDKLKLYSLLETETDYENYDEEYDDEEYDADDEEYDDEEYDADDEEYDDDADDEEC